MVGNVCRGWFGSTDGKITIHLPRINGNDFSILFFGQTQAQFRFAGSGGAGNCENHGSDFGMPMSAMTSFPTNGLAEGLRSPLFGATIVTVVFAWIAASRTRPVSASRQIPQ